MGHPRLSTACLGLLLAACTGLDRPPPLADVHLDESDQVGGTHTRAAADAGPVNSPGTGGSPGVAVVLAGDCAKGQFPGTEVAWDDAGLEVLRGYTSIEGDFTIVPPGIETKTAITTLRALSCLESVGGLLTISKSPKLTSLDGLGALRTVRNLSIFDNDKLTSLAAFQELQVENALTITRNRALVDLGQGFIAAGGIGISLNDVLPQCQVDALAEKLGKVCLGCSNYTAGSCD
jgi:hypothetical protein